MLSIEYKERLESLKAALNATYPIKEYHRETIVPHKTRGPYLRKQDMARLRISSRKMCADLARLGITPRKTFTLEFPNSDQVPTHLMNHFVRGYFDGDGSICMAVDQRRSYAVWKLSMTSSTQFCTKMWGSFLWRHMPGMPHFKPHADSKGITIFTVNRLDDIHALKRLMYKDATTLLQRKRVIFDEIHEMKDKQRDLRRAILLHARETQADFSFPELRLQFPEFTHSTSWLALQRLVNEGQLIPVGKTGNSIRYAYDFAA